MSSRLDRITDWPSLAGRTHYNAKEMATTCSVSLRQMERYFKTRFNRSPRAWLNTMRLNEAKQRLLRGLTVKETAYSLGFRQASHFCREFKRMTGTTPSAFRRQSVSTASNVAKR